MRKHGVYGLINGAVEMAVAWDALCPPVSSQDRKIERTRRAFTGAPPTPNSLPAPTEQIILSVETSTILEVKAVRHCTQLVAITRLFQFNSSSQVCLCACVRACVCARAMSGYTRETTVEYFLSI